MKKNIFTVFKILSLSTISVIFVFLVSLHFTPRPLFILINSFPNKANITAPDNFSSVIGEVNVKKDISYSDKYSNSLLDIYSPTKNKKKLPVILFIHGGGFFKGGKEMARYFGPTISDNQYIFISIDYNLAPDATIFYQLRQINEAIMFIINNSDKYLLDIGQINLSGSSAGGFLALQLLSAYHNKEYAVELGINPHSNINFSSMLLYSAVYDLSVFQAYKSSLPIDFSLNKIGWGLTGEKDWKTNNKIGKLLNLNNYITKDFPPIFITDGNTHTFTEQAYVFVKKLEERNVSNQTLFFEITEKVGHGYQLNMETRFSNIAVEESLIFLEENNR